MKTTAETLALIKGAQLTPIDDAISKAFTQGTGLVNYDLQPVALNLYPVLTPLRNRIPRVGGNGGTATNWKAITAINVGGQSIGISEGNRNAVIATAVANYVAAYKGIGLEDNVSFEADYAGVGFDDVKAKAVLGLLRSVMIGEERMLLGANSSIALGTTGGTLAAQTISVICVALTLEAWRASTVVAGLPLSAARTNADASVDAVNMGTAIKSTAATAVLSTGTSSFTATLAAPVNGAAAYAWFWGVAGSEVLGAITSLNTVTAIANAAGTQNASAGFTADKSQNALLCDGLRTQIMTPGSNAYNVALATLAGVGTPLTSDGAGGIVEVDAAFSFFWNNSRLSPSDLYMSGATLLAVNKLVIANGGAPLIRFSMDSGGQQISAGTVIGSYLNKITNTQVKISVHPDMPDGEILFYSDSVPYPLSGVSNILQVKTRRDYYQIEWPLRTRKYEYGVYADEVLQNYFPPAFGLLKNIKV
jgi:RNase H-fold protein (predicted Holliday junction resolvase)